MLTGLPNWAFPIMAECIEQPAPEAEAPSIIAPDVSLVTDESGQTREYRQLASRDLLSITTTAQHHLEVAARALPPRADTTPQSSKEWSPRGSMTREISNNRSPMPSETDSPSRSSSLQSPMMAAREHAQTRQLARLKENERRLDRKEEQPETRSKEKMRERQESVDQNQSEPIRLPKWIDQAPVTGWLQNHEQDQGRQNGDEWTLDACVATTGKKTTRHFNDQTGSSDRPTLEPPRIGVYALYYILTKIGIISDAVSHWDAKQTIEANEEEMRKLHHQKMEAMKKAIQDEQSSKRWGMTIKIFSWMTSFMSIITGIALMITGVGVVAGALMLAGGVIALTNQILEVTGGWQKIASLLPSDDPEKRQAIITWIQVGISVLCLVLAGAGGILGGWTAVSEAMSNFMAVFSGVAMIGSSVATIGVGVTLYLYKDRLATCREYSRKMVDLRHRRTDLMEKVDDGVGRMKQLFTDLAKILDFESELFRAGQQIFKR